MILLCFALKETHRNTHVCRFFCRICFETSHQITDFCMILLGLAFKHHLFWTTFVDLSSKTDLFRMKPRAFPFKGSCLKQILGIYIEVRRL